MKNQLFKRCKIKNYSQFNKKNIYLSLILGLSHGVADAAAGFLLGSLAYTVSLEQASWLIILYNILGFGYQPVAGMLTDRFKCPRSAILVGLSLLLWALVVAGWQSQLAVVLAGLGSATFHVGGGSLALSATPNRATGPGIFAAPGVVGLAVGGALGLTGYSLTMPLILMIGIMMSVIAIIQLPKFSKGEESEPASPTSEEYDGVILALIGAIALISTVWTSFQFLLQAHLDFLIALAVAAAVGKVLAGIVAEYWGWQRWTMVSLSVATLLLLLSNENPLTLLLSLALLQSTIPITLAATGRMMPNQPATAAGLALGLAIIIGGIPVVGGLNAITATSAIAKGAPLRAIAALVVVATIISLAWVFQSKIFRAKY
jgi:FSR family fosmidomycin resistance protein-like MFS transporter